MKGGAGTVIVVVQVGVVGEEMLDGTLGVRIGVERRGWEGRKVRTGRGGKDKGRDQNDTDSGR